MRVSFRTTMEQELVEKLKRMAHDRNKNMNDILEELLYFYYGDENKEFYFVSKLPENSTRTLEEFLVNEISVMIAKLLVKNDLEVSEGFLKILGDISSLVVDMTQLEKK